MINKEWDYILKEEMEKDYFVNLINFIENEYNSKDVYPCSNDLYKALKNISFSDVKVVILGQDPYHGENEAHGLSFSVKNGVKMPPSLKNIFLELFSDVQINRTNTDLTDWSNQGVLLLNSILTVVKDRPLSHRNIGWELFTDKIIEKLGNREEPLVFILWGNYARTKKKLIKNKKHLIIESVHPSPLSVYRGFFGSKPFSKTNSFLEKNELKKIKW